MNWYCLYTKANSEHLVAASLQQRGFEVYLPQIHQQKKEHRRPSIPFFPCYLFAWIDFQRVDLSSVRSIPGLRRVIAFKDEPLPVPAEVIAAIQDTVDQYEAAVAGTRHSFKPGDTVRIVAGPLKDTLAVFDGPVDSGKRVEILLELLGRLTRAQIDVTHLKKTPQDRESTVAKRPRRTRGRGRRIG